MKRRVIEAIVVAIMLMSGVVFAHELYSPLNGDNLALDAEYEGEGKVAIYVENRSNKALNFEKKIKLVRWSTGEEIQPNSNDAEFVNTNFEPNSKGVMTIDISKMYNLDLLEQPLENDHYYFILTNNNFIFGYDWHCSIKFNKDIDETEIKTIEKTYQDKVELDKNLIKDDTNKETNSKSSNSSNIKEELQEYYDYYVIDPQQRNQKVEEYYQKVNELLSQESANGKNIITTVNPWLFVGKPDSNVIFDSRVPKELQYQLVGENHFSLDAFNIPVGSSEFDNCMVLSTTIPQKSSDVNKTCGTSIPLIYIFQYDINELKKANTYVFIKGKLFNYNDLEKYKVYQDDKYASYDMTSLFYTDIETYINTFIQNRNDIYIDDGVYTRIKNIYNYYKNKDNLSKAFYYHQ